MNLDTALDIIGVTKETLTRDKLNYLYHRLCLLHHPDINGDPTVFRRIKEAHTRLTGYLDNPDQEERKDKNARAKDSEDKNARATDKTSPKNNIPPELFQSMRNLFTPQCLYPNCNQRSVTLGKYCYTHLHVKHTGEATCTHQITLKDGTTRLCKKKALLSQPYCSVHYK